MLTSDELLDPVLLSRVGPLNESDRAALVDVCVDAASSVLGPELSKGVLADKQHLHHLLPWLWDLARGLHYQGVFGPNDPTSLELLDRLSTSNMALQERNRLAEGIDLAYILTIDRIAEYVQGKDAIKSNPVAREYTYPWYGRLTVGYHISIALESLRLISPADQ